MFTPGLSINPNLPVIGRARLPRLPTELLPIVRVCGFTVSGSGADFARFQRDLARAQAIWGPCGINIVGGPFTTITAPLDYSNWDADIPRTTLLNQRGTCPANFVRAYYVGSIDGNTHNGRAQFTGLEAGSVALSRDAHQNLFPHELGHLFLGGNEEHRDTQSPADRVNIMRSDVGTIEGFPQVDQNQCTRAVAAVRGARFTGAAPQGFISGLIPVGEVRAFETSSAPESSPVATTSHTTSLRELLATAPDAVVSFGQVIVSQLLMLVTCDPSPIIRAGAAAALAQIGGDAAQLALIGSLRDPDPAVRIAALRALAAIGSPIALASIMNQVRVEHDQNVRALAHGLAMGLQVM
ncbi:MAG TPA: HEAT repeat domain-containing protein [Symbiobacteriaceae bacterium]|nr:HEAT repeat domain-containing protein [Symbiobacteriaceae bacterium]